MYVICKNDFPFLVCPGGLHPFFVKKIVRHLQEKCGEQLGLVSPTYYHELDVSVVTQQLIEQIKLENENGIEETKYTEATDGEIGSDNQAPESTKGKSGDGSTGEKL